VKPSPLPILAALCLLAVAAPSASATPGFSLDLSGPSKPAVINHPVVLQATAKNPPLSEYSYLTWLDVALLRPEAASERFASVPEAVLIPVEGGKHLWVGENQTRRVLTEIVAAVNPDALPLPTEWHGAVIPD